MPLHNVSDASELAKLIDDGVLEADRVVAVIGKTEGNGGVNDYTRILADRAFREVLVAKGSRGAAAVAEIPIIWSGGTDGVISPHATIFATVPSESAVASSEPRLSIGFAMSEVLLPEDIGRTAMITKVADAVRGCHGAGGHHRPGGRALRADEDAAADDPHHPGCEKPWADGVDGEHRRLDGPVQRRVRRWGSRWRSARSRCRRMRTSCIDRDLGSSVASCSSGVELDRAQVVVAGNVRGVGGRYRIGHSVMRDALDADGIWAAIRDAGLELPERPHPADLDGRLVNVFLKCEASQDGQVRGRRNAMLDDSDVHWHRQIKACVGGVAAAVTGDPAVFVSVSAAHQGPDGGGPVAAIVDLGE